MHYSMYSINFVNNIFPQEKLIEGDKDFWVQKEKKKTTKPIFFSFFKCNIYKSNILKRIWLYKYSGCHSNIFKKKKQHYYFRKTAQ